MIYGRPNVMMIRFFCVVISFSELMSGFIIKEQESQEDLSAVIAEQILIPGCRALFSKENMTPKEFVEMFSDVSLVVKKYPCCYQSILGSMIDIIKNSSYNIV